MTKSEKREIVFILIKQFIESSDDAINKEKIIEKIITEIYSCGYESINRLKIVSNAINIFLTDIMIQKLQLGSKNWESADSIVGLLNLINISNLSD